MDKKVVITGAGLITPIGIGKEKFWQSVSKGVSGVSLIEKFDTSDYRTKVAASIKGFDPKDYLTPQKIYATDIFSQYALIAVKEAMEESKLDLDNLDLRRIGVIWGSSEGGINTRESSYEDFFAKGPRSVDPLLLPKVMGVAPATHISIDYCLKGLNYSLTNTCSSGAVSVGEAYRLIKHGYADVIVAGSSEAPITPAMLAGWCKLRALTIHNDDPPSAVRPFSLDRDGPVLGEGGGAVIVESLEHALKRKAAIKCEIAGYWANSDAFHLTFPNKEEQTEVMRGAIKDSRQETDNNIVIGYINAHGTATPINDKGETEAIKEVFGKRAYDIPVSSTKSMIGHLLGAAGTVELITTIMALENQFLPPTINYNEPDPECDLDYVPNIGRSADFTAALTNSFGFGGANASLVIKKYEARDEKEPQ